MTAANEALATLEAQWKEANNTLFHYRRPAIKAAARALMATAPPATALQDEVDAAGRAFAEKAAALQRMIAYGILPSQMRMSGPIEPGMQIHPPWREALRYLAGSTPSTFMLSLQGAFSAMKLDANAPLPGEAPAARGILGFGRGKK